MSQQRTCARPTCDRIAHKSGKGHCLTHAQALGIIKPYIPRDKALRAVQSKLDQGHTIWSLATAAGLHKTVLYKFMAGPDTAWGTNGMAQPTYQAILNAPLNPTYSPGWPVSRRVQALRAAGHSMQELVDGTGVSQQLLTRLSFRNPKRVETAVHEKIMAFYEEHELDEARPENPRTAKHKWPAPLDWDDIDDPDEVAIASRFFHSDGVCIRGHELYDFNQFKSDADAKNPKCKSCVSAQNALYRWMPHHSQEDLQWLADELMEFYRRGEIASPKSLIEGRVRDDQAA